MNKKKLMEEIHKYIDENVDDSKTLLKEGTPSDSGFVDVLWGMETREINALIQNFHDMDPIRQEYFIAAANDILMSQNIYDQYPEMQKDLEYYGALEKLSMQENPGDVGDSMNDYVERSHANEIEDRAQYYSNARFNEYDRDLRGDSIGAKFEDPSNLDLDSLTTDRMRKLAGLNKQE